MGKKREATSGPRQIIILDGAYQDIEELTDFIAIEKQQPVNAVNVARTIWQTIDKIKENPLAYKECEELATAGKLYRRAVCLSWIIVYKVTSSEIKIIGVMYAGRKPSKIRKFRKRK